MTHKLKKRRQIDEWTVVFLTCFWRHVNFAHFHRYFFDFPTKSCSKGLKKDLTISVTQLDLQRIDLFCHICTNFYHNFNFIWHKRPRVRVSDSDSLTVGRQLNWETSMTSLNKYTQINQSFCWSVDLVCRQCFFASTNQNAHQLYNKNILSWNA